jgi:hypothetical protein
MVPIVEYLHSKEKKKTMKKRTILGILIWPKMCQQSTANFSFSREIGII